VKVGAIQLREATGNDDEFIYRLIEATMRAYVENIWGTFSEERNHRTIAETIRARNCSIIQLEDQDIGVLTVERQSAQIRLTQLYILPSHQNQGIGASLVRGLAREARESGKPLRLSVLAGNPAKRLYEREGFRVTKVTPERVSMELVW
jgi:GNAT superfamily N-acetyltransferase